MGGGPCCRIPKACCHIQETSIHVHKITIYIHFNFRICIYIFIYINKNLPKYF